MYRFLTFALPLVVLVAPGARAQGGTTCNITTTCPDSAPCCSSFGFCGTGSFCQTGCNPLASHALDSCRPDPVCQSGTHAFTDDSRIYSNATKFDGNVTAYDWVVNSGNIMNTNSSGGELALLLTETNGGTRVSSTRYIHYGRITVTLKTGRWAGVVTAAVTMSDVKDEVDWEFPGANTSQGQSNMFWQGVIPEKTIGGQHDISSDSFSNYHDYTIDWQEDQLSWLIDNKTVRTLKQSDMVGSDGVSRYPNTPSSFQMSIWPAGINSSAQGTIDWAGGMINWDDADYKSAGHFWATIKQVTIECNDPTPPSQNVTSYAYASNSSAFTPGVQFSNASVLLNAGERGAAAAGGAMWVAAAGVVGVLAGFL